MNFFLLFAVPLAAVAAHQFLHPGRNPFSDSRTWITGAVWAAATLVAASFFGRWREFSGSVPGVLAGLTVTDVLLVPGLTAAAWFLTRPKRDPWELALWLSLVFTMAGIRDFAATARTYDLTEYFLVPLDRIFIILTLPGLMCRAAGSPSLRTGWTWWALSLLTAATGALVPAVSFTGWGWAAWLLLAGGLGWILWTQKKAVPRGNGFSQ